MQRLISQSVIGGHKFCLKKIDFHGADGAGGDAKFTAVAFFGIK